MIKDKEDISTATIYALAIYQSSERQGILNDIIEEVEEILNEALKVKKFLQVLNSSNIGTHEKHQIIEEILGKDFSPLIKNVFHVVVDAGRSNIIAEVFSKFLELVDNKKGITYAEIYTVLELTKNERKELQEKLEHYFKKKFRIDFLIDPRLIGGVLFKSGDIAVDFTIKGELAKIKERLIRTEIGDALSQVNDLK